MFLSAALCYGVVLAQPPAPSPKNPIPPIQAGRISADKLPATPQVVTIVHRINGLKMFRLLLRSEAELQSIAALDSSFSLLNEVHINVIAGLAMDDGETIAAWLPEAEVELSPPGVPAAGGPPAPRFSEGAFPGFGNSFFEVPDVSVIGPDGKQRRAKYVGFDAVTGLSILRLGNGNSIAAGEIKDEPINTGETVLLFSPEPVPRVRPLLNSSLYARIGAIEGRIKDVLAAPSGGIARFRVAAARLSQANIGGIATNEAGETIGIISELEGNEAGILPASQIRRAAQRVLEKQASVPRPWLGVRGEAIAALKVDQILNHGWELTRASALANQHQGIMLTSILPGSPAAMAALRAGDVILKVDDNEIQTAEDFTWWLEQAGPSKSVEFTVVRPDRPAAEPLNVKLSGVLDRTFNFNFRWRLQTGKGFALIDQGIETITLKPLVAAQLGITAGLLVVYVDPVTAAFDAGLQPGDVIKSINGKGVSLFRSSLQPATFTFEIVRNKEKLTIKVPAKKK